MLETIDRFAALVAQWESVSLITKRPKVQFLPSASREQQIRP
jgi:hypothetical protein